MAHPKVNLEWAWKASIVLLPRREALVLRLAPKYVTERKINVFSKRWLFMVFSDEILRRAGVSEKPLGF
jgi:hypothetical protein